MQPVFSRNSEEGESPVGEMAGDSVLGKVALSLKAKASGAVASRKKEAGQCGWAS